MASASRRALLFACLFAAGLPATAGTAERDLTPHHREWLEEIRPLITKKERRAFLALEKDHQRDGFIERFWAARDPRPETPENEFRDRYYARREEALERYGGMDDQRALVFLLNGPPGGVLATDCGVFTVWLELWRYGYSDHLGHGFSILFYQPIGGGPYRIWDPSEGYRVLLNRLDGSSDDSLEFQELLEEHCTEISEDVRGLLADIRAIEFDRGITAAKAAAPPRLEDPEWMLAFHAHSTDLPEDVAPLAAHLDFRFPAPFGQRTLVEGLLEVSLADAGRVELGDRSAYAFELTGEVLRGTELFESFRYRYELPAAQVGAGPIPLVFERHLRPGAYTVVVKLADLAGGGAFREERELVVPAVHPAAPGAAEALEDVAAEVGAAAEAAAGLASIRLSAASSDLRRGLVRFEARAEGQGIAKVAFLLDQRPILTKTRPPYSVELDLGALPRRRSVRVVALGADGTEVATDEIVVNPGRHAFRVRLIEPRAGTRATGPVRVRAAVEHPAGEGVERVELYRDGTLAATLFQEPWVQPVDLGGPGETIYLRAVAYLADGNAAEDLVLLDSADFGETVDVRLVELFATVLDAGGQPVHDLGAEEFRVLEGGQEQSVLRFDRLEDLPLHAVLLIDTSASMAEHLTAVRAMARSFFEETIRSQDRASVVTFSERPRLVTEPTSDVDSLLGALTGIHPEAGTALWDSLVFALYSIRDVTGQRALIVLSDGEDRRSEYSFEQALQYATATGATIYAVALEKSVGRSARGQLRKLAETTGGRAFFLGEISELAAAYDAIERDLRARYLLVYQAPASDGEGFRPIEVRVARPGHEVRTLQGYFP